MAWLRCVHLCLLLGVGVGVGVGAGGAQRGVVLDFWLVPHAHCDVGWIETLDVYYNDSVKLILSSVTQRLLHDTDARFVWSETKWLSMWWPEQSPATQAAFRLILQRGQLEFVGGGWSQNDEITTHFRDTIQNQVTGHQWLMDTFGAELARIRWGWQIDMFAGYASTTPALWSMMEYDGMVIRWEGRDDAMQLAWAKEKAYQFRWQPSKVLSARRSEMFCHIIDGNYGDLCPHNSYVMGFGCDERDVSRGKCCATGCEVVAAVNATNVGAAAKALVAQLRAEDNLPGSKDLPYQPGIPLMYPWGADFHFREAGHSFGNMSLVIAEIAAHPARYNVTVRLSTMSEYFDFVHATMGGKNITFPVKTLPDAQFEWGWPKEVDEHGLYPFNYTNQSEQFQTGALTSRARHKQHSRRQAVKAHAAMSAHALATIAPHHRRLIAKSSQELLAVLVVPRDSLGVVQHHDSMPGTMEPSVLQDYEARLGQANLASNTVLRASMRAMASDSSGGSASHPDPSALPAAPSWRGPLNPVTPALGESRREDVPQKTALPTGTKLAGTTFTVFNPLVHERTTVVSISVPEVVLHGQWVVQTSTGNAAAAQFDFLDHSVVHFAATVPGLGYETFECVPVHRSASTRGKHMYIVQPTVQAGARPINNTVLQVGFDGGTGLLSDIVRVSNGTVTKADVTQELAVYTNVTGGAYLLIETGPASAVPGPVHATTVHGPVMSEVVQRYGHPSVVSFASQRIRLMRVGNQDTVRITHEIGTLQPCTEIISRFRTDLKSTVLETDSTGMESHRRGWDARGIGANYHAVVQQASVVEATAGSSVPGAGTRQLALLTTHTMGAASLAEGALELMMMRRLNTTDNQGPAPLDDTDPINVTVALLFGPALDVTALRLRRAIAMEHPLIVLSAAHTPPRRPQWGPLTAPVHPNAHLLSLSVRWGGTTGMGKTPLPNSTMSLIIRWMNVGQEGAPISVPLIQLVNSLTNSTRTPAEYVCRELSLSLLGSRAGLEGRRKRWGGRAIPYPAAAETLAHRDSRGGPPAQGGPPAPPSCGWSAMVEPFDIRTFEVSGLR